MVALILTNRREALGYERITAFAHEPIVEAIEAEMKVSASLAADLFEDVKKFLYLCATFKAEFCAPPRLDRAWHIFVTYTEEYEDFCRSCLRGFVHHRPHRGLPPVSGLMRTYGAAHRLFGDLSQRWLPRDNEPSSCVGVFVPMRTH